jgi:predicted metal-dependent hydrolase
MDLSFSAKVTAEEWTRDDALLKCVLGALSVAFPPGERLFIDSVRHYLPQIEDAELRAQIKSFIGQEAKHTKEHLAFNAFLDRAGFPAKALERWVGERIARIQKASRPEANLARTAALEHFTAILAGAFIDNPEVLDKLDPEEARLWAWHAIEEIEHRAVAFDVYERAVGDEALRLRTMRLVTVLFVTMVSIRTAIFLHTAGRLFDPRAAAQGFDLLWGRTGLARQILPHYLAYYREGFHPSQHDNRRAVERAKARYLDEV